MPFQGHLEVPGYVKGDSDKDFSMAGSLLCQFSKASCLEDLTSVCCLLLLLNWRDDRLGQLTWGKMGSMFPVRRAEHHQFPVWMHAEIQDHTQIVSWEHLILTVRIAVDESLLLVAQYVCHELIFQKHLITFSLNVKPCMVLSQILCEIQIHCCQVGCQVLGRWEKPWACCAAFKLHNPANSVKVLLYYLCLSKSLQPSFFTLHWHDTCFWTSCFHQVSCQ